MDWNRHWNQCLDTGKTLRAPSPRIGPRSRLDAKINAGSADIAQAVALFKGVYFVRQILESAGVELAGHGVELHTVNGCPLAGCASTHDAFRVHTDRSPGDSRGPQWACRKCGRGGDVLRLAMYLDDRNPNERGETARFLRERGYLQSPVSRAGTGNKPPARTRDFAQERFGSPGAGSGRVKASNARKGTPDSATKKQEPRPSAKGQVPCVPAPFSWEGQAVPAVNTPGLPRHGEREGQAVPAANRAGANCAHDPAPPDAGRGPRDPAEKPGGLGGAVPADPLRWFRPDALAAFGRRPTPDEIEALDERAGIIQFDAGLTRQDAEREALNGSSWTH